MRSCMTEIGNIRPLALCRSGVNPTSMHRGMDDIQASIEVLRHYLRGLVPFAVSLSDFMTSTPPPPPITWPPNLDWYKVTFGLNAEPAK